MQKESERSIHQKRSWKATIITSVLLVFLALFVGRVLFFIKQIHSGDLDLQSLNFTSKLTSNETLAKHSLKEGMFDVSTLDDPSFGATSPVLTIVEFADFGCSFSRDESFVLRELMNRYPEQIRYIYRDFPLTDLHPLAQEAAEAGECAQDQGKFWEYHDKLYQNQATLSSEQFMEFAQMLNLNVAQFQECMQSRRYKDEVLKDYQDGIDAGVYGTPTFFINGNRIEGAIPADVFEALIQASVNQS